LALLIIVFANFYGQYLSLDGYADYAFLLSIADISLISLIVMSAPLIIGAFKQSCSLKFISILSAVNSLVLFVLAIVLMVCGVQQQMFIGGVGAVFYYFINAHSIILLHENVHKRIYRIITVCLLLLVFYVSYARVMDCAEAIAENISTASYTTEGSYAYEYEETPETTGRNQRKKGKKYILGENGAVIAVEELGDEEETSQREETEPRYINNPYDVMPIPTISHDVIVVKIAAESSAGVGDVFTDMVASLDYRIIDNTIGDSYLVNYKAIGGVEEYQIPYDRGSGDLVIDDSCPIEYRPVEDCWYSVTLSDGTEAFVWGGSNAMYVTEIFN